ncbi:M14 family zinc carboxypeptidase [Aliikangiella coralliicola]|uniref:Peptidase n=1 Tax=Aliikangiella coralliicola TaxID=2592383 RepID=A0A545UDJ9_9GAMM|nr:M14 family zinc carboxypeptidase [Aliikangiella coralliicola]TQV87540.1 peptidase [Aliikangiella coralliicola]
MIEYLLRRLAFLLILAISTTSFAGIKMKPTPLTGLDYSKKLLSGNYDAAIPTPESLLGFPVGQRTATPTQIVNSIQTWEQSSDKIKLVEYARSHENRPLYYAIISTPANLAKIDDIKNDLAQLANPKGLNAANAKKIIDRLPAVAWMAYSIHGNESSGADASLAAIYHLIASQENDVADLLSKSVIIIDPSMNPDGRARFTKALEQNRGIAPNVDDQSMLHSGLWPYGRTNHYLFDLNRDFILGVHPETVGRVKAINQWHPQLMIDGHEMGAQSTYLFAPAREPINKNLSKYSKKWGNIFAKEQAGAFDSHNWPYYTGEWFENLYPGYSSYAEFRGSIHILYEQARMSEDGVRQRNNRILTYQEAVHHQLISTLANLKTLVNNSKEIYRDYLADRRKNVSADSQFANISYAILPTKNRKRWLGFIRLMELQGFELFTTTKSTSFSNAKNQLGETVTAELPKGTLIIRNRQPEARLLAAMLEFDAQIDDAVLIEERQKVLRDGSSLMYDTTAWNLTMMHGVEAFTIPTYINANLKAYEKSEPPKSITQKPNSIAYVVDGADDASVGFAARLLEQGLKVRVIDRQAKLDDTDFSRGSVVVYRYDNEFFHGNLDAIVESTAKEMSVHAQAIVSGLGDGDLPDIGGSYFRLLEKPKIAILTQGGINTYDYGAIWHSIESNLGIRHSHLDLGTFGYNDLRRYNTLVIPDRFYGKLEKNEIKILDTWVKAGGTLIAIDGSIPALVAPSVKFSSVRQLNKTFKDIDQYDLSLRQEWLAQQNEYDVIKDIWSHNAAEKIEYPWSDVKPPANEKTLKKQDEWLSKFMPSGAIVAARSDKKHWLSYGVGEMLPVLVSNNPILMSDSKSEAVVRLGVYKEMDKSVWQKVLASFKNKPVSRKVGWSSLPDEYELKLRMSGLLWPEASQRMANSAYLTRERKGNGQIILFASQPVFRGSTLATNRLLLNALVYGPGLGTKTVISNL